MTEHTTENSFDAWLETFLDIEDLSGYNNDDEEGSLNEGRLSFTRESVARDVFFGPQGHFDTWAQNFADAHPNLVDVFDMDNAKVVLSLESQDGSVEEYEYWFANPEKNWLLVVSGSVGEYYDDAADVRASYDFDLRCDQATLEKNMQKRVQNHVITEARSLELNIQKMLKNLPEEYKIMLESSVEQGLKSIEMFKPIFAEKENKEISSHIQTKSKPSLAKKM